MQKRWSLVAVSALVILMSGCSVLPRGAGLQSEVLRNNEVTDAAHNFVVAPVTREALPMYASWPEVNEPRLNWIRRTEQPANRIIAPGDSINVTVWNTDENGLLTSPGQRAAVLNNLRVSSGGTVFLPYVGTLKLSGMSPETARERIEAGYSEVMPSAQVQFELTEGRQNTVSLVGGVGKPGVFPLPDRDYTVMGLIAQGGGVMNSLNNPQIRLHRAGQIYGTSVDRLLGNPSLDTTLIGGDKVFVEPDERFFLSLGAAGSEAVHTFTRDEMSALEALSLIGGLADNRADAQGILVLRQYPEEVLRADGSGPAQSRVVFTLDLTSADGLFSAGEFPIRSGDLVYATESPVISAQTILSLLGSGLGLRRQIVN